jgi:hypothetical protein
MSRWFLFRVFVVTGFTLVFLSIFRVGIVTEKNVTVMHASHETRHGIDRFRSYDLYLSLLIRHGPVRATRKRINGLQRENRGSFSSRY